MLVDWENGVGVSQVIITVEEALWRKQIVGRGGGGGGGRKG
jgi:hypothetical protein